MQGVSDATQLRKPDCVPILMPFGNLLSQMEGLSQLELYEHPEKAQAALEKAALRFQPDLCDGLFGTPQSSRVLGDDMTKWPGYGLEANGYFQYHEAEYMKAEDYDAFLLDPADWGIRHCLLRVFSEILDLGSHLRSSPWPRSAFLRCCFAGPNVSAPFDLMAESLRGMHGSFTDMGRCPEKLLAVEEKMIPVQIEHSVTLTVGR